MQSRLQVSFTHFRVVVHGRQPRGPRRVVSVRMRPLAVRHTDVSDASPSGHGELSAAARFVCNSIHAARHCYWRSCRKWPGDLCWRRGSESNRRTRICSPLHDHSATPPCHAITKPRNRTTRSAGLAYRQEAGGASFYRGNLERERSLELPTSTLARLRSTN